MTRLAVPSSCLPRPVERRDADLGRTLVGVRRLQLDASRAVPAEVEDDPVAGQVVTSHELLAQSLEWTPVIGGRNAYLDWIATVLARCCRRGHCSQ